MTNLDNTASIDQLLLDWSKTIDSQLNRIADVLSNDELTSIINDYNARWETKIDIGFNIFILISDLYYRENFHRDIIYELLEPNGSHKQGDKYLMLFLDMLNISHTDFKNAIVEKEFYVNSRRIDTLIRDETSKKAIIIENKMNDATDMPRQLPDYYNYVSGLGYEVKSIVYIPLLDNKAPDESDWEEEEKESIKKCLRIIPAFSQKGETNLSDDWLLNCINNSDDIDCISGIRQYIKLIKHLNINSMDYLILDKFYKKLLEQKESLDAAKSVRNMLNSLPAYLAERIFHKYEYNYAPFKWISIYKETDVVFGEFIFNEESYQLDIWCDENGYELYLWKNGNKPEDIDIKSIFSNSEILKEFRQNNEYYTNSLHLHIGFYEEEKVYSILDALLKELSAMKS